MLPAVRQGRDHPRMLLAQAVGPHVGGRGGNQGSEWLTPFLAPRAWPEGAELRVTAAMTPSPPNHKNWGGGREKPRLGEANGSWSETPLPLGNPPSRSLSPPPLGAEVPHPGSAPLQSNSSTVPQHVHGVLPRAHEARPLSSPWACAKGHRHAPNSRRDAPIVAAPTSGSRPPRLHVRHHWNPPGNSSRGSTVTPLYR